MKVEDGMNFLGAYISGQPIFATDGKNIDDAFATALGNVSKNFNFNLGSVTKSALDWINPITGVVNAVSNIGSSIFNYAQQKENLQYQKWLQQQTWSREDSAVQRRKEDLVKAGFNPILATGQSAQSGAVVSTTAPQYSNKDIQAMDFYQGTLAKMQVLSSMLGLQAQQQQIKALEQDVKLKKQMYSYNNTRMPAWLSNIISAGSSMFRFRF